MIVLSRIIIFTCPKYIPMLLKLFLENVRVMLKTAPDSGAVCVLFFFCKNFFLPRSFMAFGTFHISCSARMHCEEHTAVFGNMSVSALLAFIVAGFLLDF